MMFRSFSAVSLLALLAACGGGGGPSVQDVDSEVEAPQNSGVTDDPCEEAEKRGGCDGQEDPVEEEEDGSELGETLEASQQPAIELTGIAFIRNARPARSTVALRNGQFTEADGTRTLDGQVIELTGDVPGTFTQASSFIQQNSEGAVGIIGIATDPTAMPTAGQATFTGGAVMDVTVGDNGWELLDGESTITADFDTMTVQATLGDFKSVTKVFGGENDAPISSVILEGATISGTSFSGGTITSGAGQSIADVVGANADSLSQGQFYGTNADGNAPTEVGGVIYTEGNEGLIFGSFIGATPP